MLTLLTLAVPLWTSLQETDLDKKVTFKINATRAKPALEELGKVVGVPLWTSQITENEVLIINVSDAPLGELMKRIAAVSSCEWQREAGGYRLIKSAAKMQQEELAERSQSTADIKKAIAQFVKDNPAKPALTRQSAETLVRKATDLKSKMQVESELQDPTASKNFEDIRTSNPNSSLLTKVVAGLDPVRLAAIPLSERRVFATNPTHMQIPLAGSAGHALADFVRDQSLLTQAADAAGLKSIDDENDNGYLQEFLNWAPIKNGVAKLLLVATRMSSDSISVELRVLAEDGSVFTSTSNVLSPSDPNGDVPAPTNAATANEKQMELSSTSKLFVDYIGKAFGMDTMVVDGDMPVHPPEWQAVPDELRSFFLNPETRDPLQLVIGDGILQMTTTENPNIVACLPDSLLRFEGMGPGAGQISARQFEAYLDRSDDIAISREKGWIQIAPKMPAAARRERANRPALGAFIRAAAAKGAVRLDDLAAYALKSGDAGASELCSMYTMMVLHDMAYMAQADNWDMLRFYGALSPSQRQGLIAGSPMSIGSLNPMQREIVNRMTFYKPDRWGQDISDIAMPDGPLPADEQIATGPPVQIDSMAEAQMASFGMNESTEALPNGLPWAGEIKLKVTQTQVMRADGNRWFGMSDMTADTIAGYLAMQERPELFGNGAASFKLDLKSIRIGQNMTYDFTFDLDPKYKVRNELNDVAFTGNASYTLETLPAAIKKQIDEALANYRQAYKDMKRDDMPTRIDRGVSKPPPPR